VVIKPRYLVKLHKLVNSQDLPLLSPELRADFFRYQQILALDPYKTYGVASHNLLGKLASCRALEIDWNGVAHRLVYRVYESPAPKRVLILSFGEHDPAYLNAQARR
jgi:mRNA interferase RelE/StbE